MKFFPTKYLRFHAGMLYQLWVTREPIAIDPQPEYEDWPLDLAHNEKEWRPIPEV
jgi:hypothetical protein